ncbi:PREDICTED: squamosa promoter-binding-like protein 14 isoform X2 [Lupinus angustifolius]|uniref:squamosa promoter-binding-like protein 14 isoform X2 n=1 Tax=Lupinus angustifolius TaxID=3871 RepID=UPI00092F470E|nr:PREDICTED: squamosa promoter-binding-like protein 14 isoform X2 [Lupinus angustifolius]
MEKLAPPIFIHKTKLPTSYHDSSSSMTINNTKKRDLSHDLFQNQTTNENWNPKAWSWDSVNFLSKPLTQNNNKEVDDETVLELNLGRGEPDPTVVRPNKKVRSGSPSSATTSYPTCQVDNCREDLSSAKDYHRRHKVCELHSKASKALLSNQLQRFCQQCSRFHPLSEFDEGKRSCRRRLAGHNRRRRKTQQEDVTSQPENVTTGNMEICSLLTAIARSQGKFEEISKIGSQVPQDKDHLFQILNRLALPADLALKLLNVGNFNGNVQTSSYDHDKLNQSTAPLTKDLLAGLSTALSTSVPDATASLSQNCSQSSGSEKSRTSAEQIVGANLQTRRPTLEFTSVGGERSSGSSQSPVEDSDCPEVRVNLPLQLFSCSPENECLPKMVSSQKYFSSDSSNPVEERSLSSSPPVMEKQFNLQGVTRGLNPESFSIRREINANKEARQNLSCNISLHLSNGSNSRIQPGSLQSVPFQPGYASSGSDHSPPSLNSDAQDRTGRIMFKLFDKDPSHFPGTLRTQIYNWLSSRPSDLESHIRPGCVVLSVYATMSSAAWEQLEENFLQRVHSLLQNSNSDFWRNGRFLVHSGSRLASHKDGNIRLCKPWRTWRSPEVISVSPLAIVSGQETCISLKGRNLSTPGTKIHCTGTGRYTSEEVIGSAYHGNTYDKIKLSGFKVQNASGVLGRCFIEVENGFKGDSFPVIIANSTICKELRPLESEFDSEEVCDAISDEHENDYGRPRSREEALHFLNELGWLFQRERFQNVHEVQDYSLDRFKFVLTFAVERNCCMLVKTLLDLLVDKHLEGESLSASSVNMLNAIQLLNRAVKRKYRNMVDLLICYSIPLKNETSRRFVFPPNVGGQDGITPLHLAACTSNSEGVIDSLTNDPQEIGLKCWESLVDVNGQTPHAYAMIRNNHFYNVLVARKHADKQRGQVSLTMDNEIGQSSLRIELRQKQGNKVKRGQNSCVKCVMAESHSYRKVPASRGFIQRPFIHSMLAVAAVCVCVCLFMRGAPSIGSVAPFRWEKMDYGTH